MDSKYSHHSHNRKKNVKTARPRLENIEKAEDKENCPRTADASHLPIPSLAEIFKPSQSVAKEYHLDGDFSMYTSESLEKRKELKTDPELKETIEDFMGIFVSDPDGLISKYEYEKVYMKICRILRPDIDSSEFSQLFEEDWKKDSRGFPKMTNQMLYDCLYELCDIWCPNIDVEEYKCFFSQLKFRMTYQGYGDSDPYSILN